LKPVWNLKTGFETGFETENWIKTGFETENWIPNRF
jgi:hypothetical protein